ncbi:MAG: hypothetical protein WDN28_01335 [Chthoniobacter sp.]
MAAGNPVSWGARFADATSRRQARAKPVQTSTIAPLAAPVARAWPNHPPASPVWMKRAHSRSRRPAL